MRQLKISKSITNRESASLDKYLQEIGKEEMISAEEEVELAQAIKRGDQKALERLTRANLRFVVSVAKQYQNQVGSVNKINREISKFEQVNERRPSVDEIAGKIDLPEEKIDEAMNINGRHVSVDAPFTEGEDSSLLDVLVNEDVPTTDKGLVDESLQSEIQVALGILGERERAVIEASYGIGCNELTLEEIGEKFGLSRERVRQIKEKAIRKLRNCTKNKILKTYLG